MPWTDAEAQSDDFIVRRGLERVHAGEHQHGRRQCAAQCHSLSHHPALCSSPSFLEKKSFGKSPCPERSKKYYSGST